MPSVARKVAAKTAEKSAAGKSATVKAAAVKAAAVKAAAVKTAPGKVPAVKQAPAATRKAPAADTVPDSPLVRDSYTIPAAEYEALLQLKQRCLALGHPAKKSELLRAGLKALAGLGDAALLKAARAVPALKTGRPKARKDKGAKKEKAGRPAKAPAVAG
jgi:hypothetical protein